MADINIFALGGQDENGKNSYAVEVGNDIFLINSGIKVPIGESNGIDWIIPDYNYLQERKDRVKGIFITNAKDDVFASIPWLIMDLPGVPVYASEYTNMILKERVSKYNVGKTPVNFKNLEDTQVIGGTTVNSFSLANAVPGALGISIDTKDGAIVYIGSTVLDKLDQFGNTDLEQIKKIANNNILALLLESGRSNYKGHAANMKSVIPAIRNFFDAAKDDERIIIGAYDEDVYQIHEVIEYARKTNRPIISYGRAFDSLYKDIKTIYGTDIATFEDYRKIDKLDNAVVLLTGTWSRLYQRLVRIALKKDVFMKFRESDNVIMIAPPTNGMEVEYADSLDEVARIAPNILDVSDKDFYPLRCSKDDIREVVTTLKPKYFLPVSGLYRYLVVAKSLAEEKGMAGDKTVILMNGRVAHFQDGALASQNNYIKRFGDVIIDGFGVGDVSEEVIRERKTLATGGLISVAIKLDRRTKQPIGDLNIQVLGVVVKEDLKATQDEVNNIVRQKLEEVDKFDYREVQNGIRKKIRRVMRKIYDKEPLVVITLFEV